MTPDATGAVADLVTKTVISCHAQNAFGCDKGSMFDVFLERFFRGLRPLACLVALLFAVPAAQGSELEEREAMYDRVWQVGRMMDAEGLSALAEHYRHEDQRTSSGLEKLALFYIRMNVVAHRQVNQGAWDGIHRELADWIKAEPNSPTPYLMRAIVEQKQAYAAYHAAQTPQDVLKSWPNFQKAIRAADARLTAHADVASTDSYYYIKRLELLGSLGLLPDEIPPVIAEGLERHPRAYQLYFRAVDYFGPSWRGNKELMEAFARHAVSLSQEAEGLGMYARIYWYASQTALGDALFEDSLASWEMMERGVWDVIDRYPDQWNIQNFAYFACLAEDKTATGKLMERIEGAPIPRIWRSQDVWWYCSRLGSSL